MATTTPNYGWPVPTSTDLVKNGATAIEGLGDAIDSSFVGLKGGTTGQVLSKTSNTDLAYSWVTQDDANAIQNSIVDAKGDLISATANDTPARLAVGSNGETLVADSSTSTGLRYQGSTAAGRNFLINGNTDIWQRGTSFSIGTSPWTYTADRWAAVVSAGTATYAQETTVIPSGSRYSMKITAGATQIPYFAQEIETMNTIPFAGQTITFSAQVAASASIPMSMVVGFSTNVDEPVANSHTAITATSGGTATPTSTTFVTISGTYAIPSTAKSIRVYLAPTSNITSGQIIYIGKLQFEIGSVATGFSRAGGTIQGELAACQRYYWRTSATSNGFNTFSPFGNASSTTQGNIPFSLPVPLRVVPSSVDFSANLRLQDFTAGHSVTSLTIDGGSTVNNPVVTALVSLGLIQFRTYVLSANNSTSAYVGFSAEL